MSKKIRPRSSKKQKKQQGSGVVGWIAGMAFLGYMGAELILVQKPHPLHWLAAALVGVPGFRIEWMSHYWQR